MKQEMVGATGINWNIRLCESFVPHVKFTQITTPAPHYSILYRQDVLPGAESTVTKNILLKEAYSFEIMKVQLKFIK